MHTPLIRVVCQRLHFVWCSRPSRPLGGGRGGRGGGGGGGILARRWLYLFTGSNFESILGVSIVGGKSVVA